MFLSGQHMYYRRIHGNQVSPGPSQDKRMHKARVSTMPSPVLNCGPIPDVSRVPPR